MSKIVAIMPCRNSAWVLGLSARALLMWVDELHILCHACTDRTKDIAWDLMGEYGEARVRYLHIESGIWQEMAHRQLLLQSARVNKATHIVTIDDDEVVTGNLIPAMRKWIENLAPGIVLQLPWLQMRGSIGTVISSGMWAEQNKSVAFLDQPDMHWEAKDGYDHHHTHPYGTRGYQQALAPGNRTGGLMHLQMASERRLHWKQYLYKLIERKRWPDRMTPAALNAMYDPSALPDGQRWQVLPQSDWWTAYSHLMQHLDVYAEPWQEAEARRLLAENPGLGDGLTDYGIKGRPVTEAECTNSRGDFIPPG